MVRYFVKYENHCGSKTNQVSKSKLDDTIITLREFAKTDYSGKHKIIKQKVTWIDGVKTIEETDVTEAIDGK